MSALLPDPSSTAEITVHDVAAWIELPPSERPRLIDCREREEIDFCRIEGHDWIPLGTIPTSVQAIQDDSERGVVVYCHHGMRSLQAANFLRAHGCENVFSMAGGIDAWSRFIDSSVPRY